MPLDRIVSCFGQECFLLFNRDFSSFRTGMIHAFGQECFLLLFGGKCFIFVCGKNWQNLPTRYLNHYPIVSNLFTEGTNKKSVLPHKHSTRKLSAGTNTGAGETNSIKGLGHQMDWAFLALHGKSRPEYMKRMFV